MGREIKKLFMFFFNCLDKFFSYSSHSFC